MRKIIFLVILSVLFACGPREFELPADVKEVLDQSGENRPELEQVINHYKESGNVIGEEAAYFLIGNMKNQGYLEYKLVDSTGAKVDFNVRDYKDYDALLDGWDEIENNKGSIHFEKDTLYYDYNEIKADYLIMNIDLAQEAWEENPWASHLNFEQFCEYVLPYRSSNEPIEEWREYFIRELSWVKDSVKDQTSPVEAACFVNDYIKSWFRFDPRYYEHPTDQGLQEMLNVKLGRCEDMTNLAIYAMRALGIPVMSDFTPYWANTGNNHAWNAILDKNDSTIIFMGGEANPGEYSLGHKMAKVYRKTYAIQKNSLPEKMEKWEKAPPYLNSSSIRDVTPAYVPTSNVKIELTKGIPDSTNFAYLCVFNSGEWKAIDYTRLYGNKATYSKMGLGVAYLPAFYYDKEIIPAGDAFILTDSAKVEYKVPDGKKRIDLTLFSTTKRITKETTDFIEHAEFNSGKSYILFYWNDKWIEAGKNIAIDEPLVFKAVPSNAIYWLVEDGSRKEERIFTVDDDGKQVWW
ncbi:MAG: transglutaminase domain-containing protein [Bacteroidales bacterium]|nr:transglutaminase domain-containing protein [Bacteroidales bacterium]